MHLHSSHCSYMHRNVQKLGGSLKGGNLNRSDLRNILYGGYLASIQTSLSPLSNLQY